jgi:uncharacterized phiE125 gp8 family phage protein
VITTEYRQTVPATRPIRTTEPTAAQEPIDIDTAKRKCGIALDNGYIDTELAGWIASARHQVEHDAVIACYTGAFVWKITWLPCGDFLEINLTPVTAVTSITYTATDGTTTTWGAANYSLDYYGLKPVIKLAYGSIWPTIRGDINGITINLTAGYASVLAIPPLIKDVVGVKVVEKYRMHLGEWQEAERLARGYDSLIADSGLRLEQYA